MENPQIAKRIVEKGILAAKARVAAKRALKNLVWKFPTFQGN
ncbi:DNA gyrase subunit B [Streptococcus pneumoniae]|nr:DNA gyrase subunit B [Streptococcus pneumoniae]